jgi:hypothetical protein
MWNSIVIVTCNTGGSAVGLVKNRIDLCCLQYNKPGVGQYAKARCIIMFSLSNLVKIHSTELLCRP